MSNFQAQPQFQSSETTYFQCEALSLINQIDLNVNSKELTPFHSFHLVEDEAASFNCEPLSQATVREAGSLLQRYGKSYGLRTLDALQLAAFSLIAEKDWSFVSADNTLCQVVKSLGYAAIDPLNTDQL